MRKNIFFSASLLFILILPCTALALGQVTAPIVIESAMRGETVQAEMIAVNSDKKAVQIQFSAEGQIKDWAEFYLPEDSANPAASSTIAAESTLRAAVFINVPRDIANGTYQGKISVISIPEENTDMQESYATVAQKIDRLVSITVSDKEEINLSATSLIPEKYNLAANEPLNIRVIYDNQGNISLAPQIRVKISKDGKNAYDMIYPYPEDETTVNPGSQREIKPLSIATAGWEEGGYLAELAFLRGDEELLEKSFQFSIGGNNGNPIFASGIANSLKTNLFWLVLILIIAVIVFASKSAVRKKI